MTSLLVQILKAFSKRERLFFIGAAVISIVSGILLALIIIDQVTIVTPADGGSYTEGVIGQPSFVNPLLAKNNTPDGDLVSLIFASAYDLSESVKHDSSFKVWDMRLKDGAVWHDGTPITSDDVIFTIQTIQNPSTLSPSFSDWQNVVPHRISEREIQFELATPYSLFGNVLKDLRPVPKKLFADLSQAPLNLRLSHYMLEPIGSGPFMYNFFEKRGDGFISSYSLKANDNYATIGNVPHIKTFVVKFFENSDSLMRAYNLGLVDGFGTYDKRVLDDIKLNSTTLSLPTSKYYAIFFNQNANSALTSSNIRQALNEAINKAEIVKTVFGGDASIEHGPIPPSVESYNPSIESLDTYDPQSARDLISRDGWQFNQNTNFWEKKGKNNTTQLSITIKTPDLYPQNIIAKMIQGYWNSIGVNSSVVTIDPQQIDDGVIRTRDYEALLYGNIISQVPDLYSLWHSSQKFYPGYNLSLYDSPAADQLIESARQLDPDGSQRQSIMDQIQKTIVQDAPAAFLVSPNYLYTHKRNLSGISIGNISLPESRFANVTNWYVETKRIFK
jgi:peptide/nickel transport system substrate-binding protein